MTDEALVHAILPEHVVGICTSLQALANVYGAARVLAVATVMSERFTDAADDDCIEIMEAMIETIEGYLAAKRRALH